MTKTLLLIISLFYFFEYAYQKKSYMKILLRSKASVSEDEFMLLEDNKRVPKLFDECPKKDNNTQCDECKKFGEDNVSDTFKSAFAELAQQGGQKAQEGGQKTQEGGQKTQEGGQKAQEGGQPAQQEGQATQPGQQPQEGQQAQQGGQQAQEGQQGQQNLKNKYYCFYKLKEEGQREKIKNMKQYNQTFDILNDLIFKKEDICNAYCLASVGLKCGKFSEENYLWLFGGDKRYCPKFKGEEAGLAARGNVTLEGKNETQERVAQEPQVNKTEEERPANLTAGARAGAAGERNVTAGNETLIKNRNQTAERKE